MRKIRNRIFLQILFPILAIYGLVVGVSIRYLGRTFRDDALNQKHAAMENITRGLDDWLLSRVSEILQLSRIPLFGDGSTEDIRLYMSSWRDTLSFLYDDLFLIQSDGRWWSSRNREGFLEDAAYLNNFFEEGRLFTYAGPYRYEGVIFEDRYVIGAPLYDEAGRISQVLTATISLKTLNKTFRFFTFEDFDAWMVVNPESTIILHSDSTLPGRREQAVFGRNFLEDGPWGSREVFVRIMRNGWKLVAFLDAGTLMEPFRQAYTLMIGLAGTLFVVVILIVLLLSAAVSRPINELTAGVHRIMAGDYNQTIISDTSDELAELADSFNRLASRMTTIRTDDRFSFLGHVAARMAHELRKPLHVIQLAAKALEKNTGDRRRFLGIINEEIEAADRFVGEILSFSHDEELDKQLYSPRLLVDRIAEKYRLIAAESEISLSVEGCTELPEIYMDVMRMEEVFGNLIQNAIDAIVESEIRTDPPTIRIVLDCSADSEIHVAVHDSGDGFDLALIDRLFDPYFTTREKGTGLGLAVSYRILMAHGAQILLDNDPHGHGMVRVIIPF